MKSKLNLTAKTTSKLTLKHTFLYAAASLGIAAILFTGAFLYFNLGNSEEAKAAPGLVSKANGTWYNANTWNNWSNPSYDNQPEWQAGTFYINHHVTYGDLTLKSGNKLIISGTLEVDNINAITQFKIEIAKTGKLIVKGDIKCGADFKITNNGILEANNLQATTQLQIELTKTGKLIIKENITNNNGGFTLENHGKIEVNGNINARGSGAPIKNYGDLNLMGTLNLDNDNPVTNTGSFSTGGINAGNSFKLNNTGTFISMDDINILNWSEIGGNGAFITIGDMTVGDGFNIKANSKTIITGDLDTGYGFVFPSNNLYVYEDFDTKLWWGTEPNVKDDVNLYNDSRTLYDLVQQLLNRKSILPIVLSYFQASITGSQTVQVEWSTFSEKDNDFFTVERSADGKNFEVLTTVEGAGSSNKKLSYSYEDKKPLTGYNYYRLKQTDFNGDFEYFKIVGVNNSHGQEASLSAKDIHINDVWPNPFTDHLNISFDADGDGEVEFLVQNVYGEVVHKTLFPFSYGENTYAFDRTANLKPGIYFVTIGENGKKLTTQKVIKM